VTRSSVWVRLLDVLAYHGWDADVFVHGCDAWREPASNGTAWSENGAASPQYADVNMAATEPWRLLLPVKAIVEEKRRRPRRAFLTRGEDAPLVHP